VNFLQQLTEWSGQLSGLLWGNVLTLGILLGTGLYLTIRMGLIQVRGFTHATALISGKYDRKEDGGEVTHFQALATALSATIGTGNIAGVATAITLGGPGALFWMWLTAFFGMATKFTECTLAVKFREISPDGKVAGGPMYTLLHGLQMKRTAALFAGFTLVASFGIGNMVQANSVVDGLGYVYPLVDEYSWVAGCILSLLVGLVILGGLKRIAQVASAIVPFMAAAYIITALIILFIHASAIPAAFLTIFDMALNPWSVGGAAVGEAIRWGVARGLFSNEAGLGSAPMAHAAARTNEPVREGLVAMLGPFIDTIIICSMTGLVIIATGAWQEGNEALTGAALTAHAFNGTLGNTGQLVVGVSLALFAYSTILAWSYYGDRSAYYLFGERAVLPYRIIYTLLVIVGAAVPLQLVWNIADITNILMALPNLLGLILLAGLVNKLKKDYMSRSHTVPDQN
jgi:AGCS family alanine or glycine:cation symporter